MMSHAAVLKTKWVYCSGTTLLCVSLSLSLFSLQLLCHHIRQHALNHLQLHPIWFEIKMVNILESKTYVNTQLFASSREITPSEQLEQEPMAHPSENGNGLKSFRLYMALY